MTAVLNSIRDSKLASIANHRPAALFFIFTIVLSWGYWIPVLATRSSITEFHVLPGGFGPAVAAIVVLWLRGNSIKEWLREGLDWRVGKRWYGIALGLPAVAGITMGSLLVAATGSVALDQLADLAPMYPVMLLFLMLVGGGQEEFGWRGLALPALQERFNALIASVIIGLVWTVWHLPLFTFGVSGYRNHPIGVYAVLVIGFAIIFTWLYNNTDGSILLAMILHGGFNTASGFGGSFVVDSSTIGFPVLITYVIPVWIVAGGLVFWYGPKTLSADSSITDSINRAITKGDRISSP